MCDCGRRQENKSSRGEFDDKLKLPENDMPPSFWIEVPKGVNSTPAIREVEDIAVWHSANVGWKIYCKAGEYTSLEVVAKLWHLVQ